MKIRKILLLIGVLAVFVNAQTGSINNTLGTGGSFIVKDGSNSFFRVNQSTGNAIFSRNLELGNLDNSILDAGVITRNSKRFLHNFAPNGSEFNNLFIGIEAGNFTMGGGTATFQSSYNVGVGSNSLKSLTTGYSNTAVGSSTLFNNTTGVDNTTMGYASMYYNQDGNFNVAIGNYSLYYNAIGDENTALGYQALYNNLGGFYNTAVGKFSLRSNTIGEGNCAIGVNSLRDNTSGLYNTAIGTEAGRNVTSGINLTLLGGDAQPSIGSAVNEITLGNNQITTLRCNVQTITSLSDVRDKKNIKDLSLGLDFLMKIKPREFNWDRREWYENGIADGSKIQDHPTAGFIAQEFDSLQNTEHAEWLNLVLKNNPDKWEATYGNLLPVIVKAVQELKLQNDKLATINEQLVEQNESFRKEIEEVRLTISVQIEEKIKSLLTQVSESEDSDLNIALEKRIVNSIGEE